MWGDYLSMLSLISAFTIMVVCMILFLSPEYDAGVVGKAALLIIIITTFAQLDRFYYTGMPQETAHSYVWFRFAVAALLARHFWRFYCYAYYDKYSWGRALKRLGGGQ